MRNYKAPYKVILTTLLFLLIFESSFAQGSDFGLWTSFDIEKKLSKRFDLELGFGNRLKDNLNQRDESFAGVSLSWSKKRFSAGTSYRLTNEKTDANYRIAHRFAVQGQYQYKLKRITISNRSRLQAQYKGINSTKDGHIPESFFRNRFKLDYNIKGIPLRPIISYEFFYRINQSVRKTIERQRWVMGMDYKINKKNGVGLSFILHETMNTKDPENRYIVAIDYKFKL